MVKATAKFSKEHSRKPGPNQLRCESGFKKAGMRVGLVQSAVKLITDALVNSHSKAFIHLESAWNE